MCGARPGDMDAKKPGMSLDGNEQYVKQCAPQSILSVITSSVVKSHWISWGSKCKFQLAGHRRLTFCSPHSSIPNATNANRNPSSGCNSCVSILLQWWQDRQSITSRPMFQYLESCSARHLRFYVDFCFFAIAFHRLSSGTLMSCSLPC